MINILNTDKYKELESFSYSLIRLAIPTGRNVPVFAPFLKEN